MTDKNRLVVFNMIKTNFEACLALMEHRQGVARIADNDASRHCDTPAGDSAWQTARLNYAAAHAAYASARAYSVWLDADAGLLGLKPTFKRELARRKKAARILLG